MGRGFTSIQDNDDKNPLFKLVTINQVEPERYPVFTFTEKTEGKRKQKEKVSCYIP